jgi:formate dehydrogenase major subunit
VPGLGTSFGRGGATTAQQDLSNADAILIMGSSMAENHPVGFQWVMEARERGAKIIHVDPRFTRTSAMADIWVPLRAGSDILFLGGLIHHVLENEKYFREYLTHYTNAPVIINDKFQDTEDLGGIFSGFDGEEKEYDPATWLYAGSEIKGADSGATHAASSGGHALRGSPGGGHGHDRGGEVGKESQHKEDRTLQNPRCVFQLLKKHFARYTPEMVERYCGIPQDVFLKAAEAFARASGPEKTAAICYAVGWTQHSNGVQIIRAAAILQLLLGNIGRPGGGILALRGHASIQGSTDIPTLYDILPGYLPMPYFESDSHRFEEYVSKHSSKVGLWANFDKYIVSLLKAWYGDMARENNDWGFNWLPRVTGDHSHFGYWLEMMDGRVEGLFVMGQNPAVGAPNGRLERKALAKLKWLVVRDMVETETASFWYDSPEVERGELSPEKIGTEIFLFPAAGQGEKDGTFTNTQRMLQWHNKAVDPPGDARSETWFMYHLGRRLKAKAAGSSRERDAGLRALTWDYSTHGKHAEPNVEEVLAEINGYTVADRTLVENFDGLRNDGSTACGCWIYSGVMPHPGENKANKREPKGLLGHGWGFAWPKDTRIIYNRASADPDGKPWSDRKKLVWWDEQEKQWTGTDTPDFPKSKAPTDPGDMKDKTGLEALPGDKPFILHPDGLGWIWVSSGLKDGPLPTHYEPLESPIRNPLYPEHTSNPPAKKKERADNPYAFTGDARFPYVLTTYRLTEHHTAGGMTRTLPHLAELQPELFTEVSPELAAEVGLEHGGFATITTPRGIIEARVMVTTRMRPMWVEGRTVHQVGLPYHWGYKGKVKGDVTNDLLAISEEPNVRIMETKALVCNIQPGRRPQGEKALEELQEQMRRVA